MVEHRGRVRWGGALAWLFAIDNSAEALMAASIGTSVMGQRAVEWALAMTSTAKEDMSTSFEAVTEPQNNLPSYFIWTRLMNALD